MIPAIKKSGKRKNTTYEYLKKHIAETSKSREEYMERMAQLQKPNKPTG